MRELLNACIIQDGNDANAGNYYYKISSKRIKAKEVRGNGLECAKLITETPNEYISIHRSRLFHG